MRGEGESSLEGVACSGSGKEKFFGWVLFFLGFLVDPGIISSRQSGGDIGLGLGYHYCIFVYTIACALSSEPKLEVTQNRGSSNPPP